MKKVINFSQFCDEFRSYNRDTNFTYEGKQVLFDAIEQYDEGTGLERELDIIALCCDFSEESSDEIAKNYSIDLSECEDEEEKVKLVEEYLNENTWVCGQPTSCSFVYQQF